MTITDEMLGPGGKMVTMTYDEMVRRGIAEITILGVGDGSPYTHLVGYKFTKDAPLPPGSH